MKSACKNLSLYTIYEDSGIPLASEKEAGLSTNINSCRGIVIDTVKQELQLPKDKLQRLLNEVQQWEAHESCTKRELESFIGIVRHASKVLQPGYSFLFEAIKLSKMVKAYTFVLSSSPPAFKGHLSIYLMNYLPTDYALFPIHNKGRSTSTIGKAQF